MSAARWRDLAVTAVASAVYVLVEAVVIVLTLGRGEKPPAPVTHPVPGAGTMPGAGAAHSGDGGHSAPHTAPAPATKPRLLMTSRFYSDGVVFVDDHVKEITHRFDPPPDYEDWDAAAERLIRDLRE